MLTERMKQFSDTSIMVEGAASFLNIVVVEHVVSCFLRHRAAETTLFCLDNLSLCGRSTNKRNVSVAGVS